METDIPITGQGKRLIPGKTTTPPNVVLKRLSPLVPTSTLVGERNYFHRGYVFYLFSIVFPHAFMPLFCLYSNFFLV